MALTNAERAKRHRQKSNVTRNGVTKSNDDQAVTLRYVTTEEFGALTTRVQLLEETVAKLAASQAKVSVVPGSSIKKFANPYSRESQAHGRMPDNSPLGRMFRGEA